MSKLMQIKHRYDGNVIYESEASSMKELVEKAVSEKVNLTGADLSRASLTNADLSSADLTDANLYYANLSGADLTDANLTGADLNGASLYYASLTGTNLTRANLTDAITSKGKLIGERPYFKVGPIGSRRDEFILFVTDNGPFVKTGCFFGSFEEFEEKLKEEHGSNEHAEEYKLALQLMKFHFETYKTF